MIRSTHSFGTRVTAALALVLALQAPALALPSSSSSCQTPNSPLESPATPAEASCCCGSAGGSCESTPHRDVDAPSSGCGCEIAAPSAPSTGVIPAAIEALAPRVAGAVLQLAACAPCAAPIAANEIYLDIGASPPGGARPLYSLLSLLLI